MHVYPQQGHLPGKAFRAPFPVLSHRNDRIGTRQAPCNGFSERTCREDKTIPDTVLAVDHKQGKALRQRRILKAIIEEQKPSPLRNRGTRSQRSVAADPSRCRSSQQKRLVPDQIRVMQIYIYAERIPHATAISTREDVNSRRLWNELSEQRQKRQYKRCFTRPSDHQISNAYHGNG